MTIDALGGQTAVATPIVAQGAAYVLAVKKPPPALYDDVARTFAIERADAFANTPPGTRDSLKTVEKDDGRLETRRHWVHHDPALLACLNPTGAWASRAGLGLIERQRPIGDRVTTEAHYSLLSAPLTAAPFAAAVRSHWGLANRVHWILDVDCDGDACRVRIGHATRNFAVVRHLALKLLRQGRTRRGGIATKRFASPLDDTDLMAILTGRGAMHTPATP